VGGCCYEVGADLLRSFSGREAGICASVRGGRTFFDLRQLVVLRLLDQGIDRAAVFTDNTCTSCASETLCSYRAQGEACGRMYTFLMIKA
jgi:copper oxidase (laccase) domain-containing protein